MPLIHTQYAVLGGVASLQAQSSRIKPAMHVLWNERMMPHFQWIWKRLHFIIAILMVSFNT
jgi:hypothetical protein